MGLDLLREEGPVPLMEDLLVPVQLESGRRWQDRRYSVAQEHQVTAMVDELLASTSVLLPQPDHDAPVVTLVCAEGEWHATAARMTALRLRHAGWDVRYLGASVPASELESHLRTIAPAAMLLSCTMAAALVGAAKMVAVAQRVGVPVVAGGAALQQANGASAALGADVVAPTVEAAQSAVRGFLADGRPRVATQTLDPSGERASFTALRRLLVQAVVEQTPGPFRPEDEAEVDSLLATMEAALLLDDAELLGSHLRWLRGREAGGQVLPAPLQQVVDLLQRTLPPDLRRARGMLAQVMDQLEPA